MNCKEKCKLEKIASLKKEYPMFWKLIKLAFITLLLIPVIIWFLYFIGDSGYILIHTSLTVGDALSVYCSLLAFLGTIFLGAIAAWQNNKANQINKETLQQDLIIRTKSYLIPKMLFLSAESISKPSSINKAKAFKNSIAKRKIEVAMIMSHLCLSFHVVMSQ